MHIKSLCQGGAGKVHFPTRLFRERLTLSLLCAAAIRRLLKLGTTALIAYRAVKRL